MFLLYRIAETLGGRSAAEWADILSWEEAQTWAEFFIFKSELEQKEIDKARAKGGGRNKSQKPASFKAAKRR